MPRELLEVVDLSGVSFGGIVSGQRSAEMESARIIRFRKANAFAIHVMAWENL
jgi:hypothetical protein